MKRLIIRPGAIGDFIVSIPAIECLRATYLEVWTAPANVPFAARIADGARAIPSTGLDLLELTGPSDELLASLRSFDKIISWYGAMRPEFREAMARLHLPVEYFVALPAEGQGRHAADFYLDQVRSIAPCNSDGIPHIACPAARGAAAVIHPFAGSARKCWPMPRFQELARRLERTMPVEWCAGPDEDLPGARRFTDLYELACWLSGARVYIGNDSGPTHLAAATGAPVVALFGPSDPTVWAPRGRRVKVVAARSMADITVEEVSNAVAHALSVL